MSDEQFQALLQALNDLQRSVDGLALDVEAIRRGRAERMNIETPQWVTRASRETRGGEG